ncbi:hypothetical protein, partial [Staphylococcus aureus]
MVTIENHVAPVLPERNSDLLLMFAVRAAFVGLVHSQFFILPPAACSFSCCTNGVWMNRDVVQLWILS